MKKQALLRGLLGFPLGVFIGYSITILISAGWGAGAYSAVVPQLAQQTGSEISAVVLQYVLSGVLGAACAAGSVVWEMNDWSLLKRTVIHFIILTASMFPIAWFAWWMPRTPLGIALYIGIFAAMYAIIFVVQYLFWKKKINNINAGIQKGKP